MSKRKKYRATELAWKRRPELCPICHSPIDGFARDTILKVLLPKGLSAEVFDEAYNRAEQEESVKPSVGAERDGYRILSTLLTDRDNVILGRAFMALGAQIVSIHPRCADRVPEALEVYEYEIGSWLHE